LFFLLALALQLYIVIKFFLKGLNKFIDGWELGFDEVKAIREKVDLPRDGHSKLIDFLHKRS
jgi:hypothetical protein